MEYPPDQPEHAGIHTSANHHWLNHFEISSALQPLCSSSNLEAAHLSWKRQQQGAVEVVKQTASERMRENIAFYNCSNTSRWCCFLPPIWNICSPIWIMKSQSSGWKCSTYLKPPSRVGSKQTSFCWVILWKNCNSQVHKCKKYGRKKKERWYPEHKALPWQTDDTGLDTAKYPLTLQEQ